MKFGLKGEFQFLVKDAKTDEVKRKLKFQNLILDCGLDGIGFAWSMFEKCAVGTNNSPPSASDSSLKQWHADSNAATGYVKTAPDPNDGYKFSISTTYRFNKGAITAAISEVGIHSSNNIQGEKRYFCRAIIKDEYGNPSTVTVLPNEYLDVVYTLFVIPDLNDTVSTFTMNGVQYTATIRPANIQTWEFSGGQGAGSGTLRPVAKINEVYYNANAALGAITGGPSTTKTTLHNIVNYQEEDYIAGTYYADTVVTLGLNYGSEPIKACIIKNVNTSNPMCLSTTPCQCVFNTPLPKDSTTEIALTIRRSWARA